MKRSGKWIKTAAAALAVSAALVFFASCEGGSDGPPTADPASEDRTGAVPGDVDLGGRTFTLLQRENESGRSLAELTADSGSSNAVDRAVLARNAAVEDALNVKIDVKTSAASADDYSDLVKNNLLSGVDVCDAIAGAQNVMSDPSFGGLFMNVYDLPYLGADLSSGYFSPDLTGSLTVGGKLYYLIGDCTFSFLEKANVLFFNKKAASSEKLDDLFQLVRDGEWTADKLTEITRGVYKDLNGNGRSDLGDFFGYTTNFENTADAFFSQFDLTPTSRDENGAVIISVDRGKAVSVFEKMIDYFGTNDVYAYRDYGQSSGDDGSFYGIFTSGRALFFAGTLSFARECRRAGLDFGILPLPKWDAAQETYRTQPQDGYTVISVPSAASDAETSGAVLDAMFALSETTVVPAYCDEILGAGDERDDESGEMLEIIRAGVRIDPGFFHDIGLSGAARDLMAAGNGNYVTYYAQHARAYEKALDEVLKKIYGIG